MKKHMDANIFAQMFVEDIPDILKDGKEHILSFLPEIFKNKINIDQDDKYYRGSFNESHELKLPAKVKIRYQNREFTTTIVSMTNNYYITKEGNVLYKEDVTIIN